MRDQYAGDISDYLKFAFLRAVAQADRRLGIAWYYLSGHDGRTDGCHVEYKSQAAWRNLDPELYDQLGEMQERSVAELERLAIWPNGTVFHRVQLTAQNRAAWIQDMVKAMGAADLVFLDPDNGLGRGALKHARIADLTALHREGRAVSIIKFPGRHMRHEDQIVQLHQDLKASGLHEPITVVTCAHVACGPTARLVPRHRFFTIAGGDSVIKDRVIEFAGRLNNLNGCRVSARCSRLGVIPLCDAL